MRKQSKVHIFFKNGEWEAQYKFLAVREKNLRDLAKWWPMLDWSLVYRNGVWVKR